MQSWKQYCIVGMWPLQLSQQNKEFELTILKEANLIKAVYKSGMDKVLYYFFVFCAFWANCFLTSKKNLKFHSAEVSVENSIQTGIRGLRGIVNAGLSWLVGTGLESPDDKNMNINELGSSGLN